MILNNTPVNEAIVSNVGEIGEFRIRNSAKAFNILSSGLYANKVKAIVRDYREGFEKGSDDRGGNERYQYTSAPIRSGAWPFPNKG